MNGNQKMPEMRVCTICKIEKPITEYHKHLTGAGGFRACCKPCRNKKNSEYEKKNAEKIAIRKVKYRENNSEKIAAQKKVYHASVRERRNSYDRRKRKEDPNYRLRKVLRTRVSNFMAGIGEKRGSAVKDLGCTINEFRLYLESLFQEGMTWENHGKWHIDHIIPLCKFDLTIREQFLKACHYTNMQPLWAKDNWKKNRFYK
jgi:hypothetical protein